MTSIEIKEIAFGSPEYEVSKQFREALLRKPLGITLSPDDLKGESSQHHYVALTSTQEIVGTVVMKPVSDSLIKLRQMAVSPDIQNGGIGRKLVMLAEQNARDKGFKTISMTARISAKGFYERLGYHTEGDEFMDIIPVPSIKMVKHLT